MVKMPKATVTLSFTKETPLLTLPPPTITTRSSQDPPLAALMITKSTRSSIMEPDAICGSNCTRTLDTRDPVWVSGWEMAQEASI